MVKLALAMIVKDDTEADSLKRALISAQNYVQGIFITGTKEPQEEIKKICNEFGAHWNFFPWVNDFSAARNHAFAQVPKEYEYILWMDADDVLHGGENLQRILEEAKQKRFGLVYAKYLYYIEEGESPCPDCNLHGYIKNIHIEHIRERLIVNDGSCQWVSKIHETCIPQAPIEQTDNNDFAIVHLTTTDKMELAIYRNIEMLQDQVLEEDGKDPRTVYYLAKAYFDVNVPELTEYTMGLLMQYLQTSGWQEERAQAWQYLGEMHRRENQYEKAVACCLEGINESHKFPSLYVDLALTYLLMQQWDKALHWAQVAATIPFPKTTLVISPRDFQMRILEVLFNVYWNTGRLEEAKSVCEKFIQIWPEQMNIDRLNMVNSALRDNVLVHCIVKLAGHFDGLGDKRRLVNLLSVIPPHLETIPVIADLKNEIVPPRVWAEDEIALYCGPGFEKWSPKSVDQGVGGSESAVIYLGKELAKLGYKLTVYGDPGEDEGEYDGVTYLPFYKFNHNDSFNIFISWRQPGIADLPLKTKQFHVWNHDIQNPANYTPERVKRIDKVFFLSKWHRDNVKELPESQIFYTANGLPDIKVKPTKRDPHKIIYSSSYDRGLEHLLEMWPKIRQAIPDATLEIFYGWSMFDFMAANNPPRQMWKKQMDEKMNQPGITHHGRVSHKELAEWYAKSGIWAYPTHFGEISCITAMMAQTYGAIPVVVNYAALRETVKHGVRIEGDIYDQETKDEYVKELIGLLKDPERQESIRTEMVAAADFSWSTVAKQWDELFKLQNPKEAAKELVSTNPALSEFLPTGVQL